MNIKQILIDQKEELKNTFQKKKIIEREFSHLYKTYLASPLIKVITGSRRSGKSTLCAQLLHSKDFAYVNFDDERLSSLTSESLNSVIESIYSIYTNPEYILLDEIQNIKAWELFVNRLQRTGFNLMITGSNSHLLSKELATHLTGRHYNLELFPFSFREFLTFNNIHFQKESLSTKQIAIIKNELDQYIQNGGFPETLTEENAKKYLQTLFSSIITNDIAIRHNIRLIKTIKDMASHLLTNFSCQITFTRLKKIFDVKSVHTIQNYLSYLEESYMIFMIERFSFKSKQRITAPRKIYAIDTGLINAVSFQHSQNIGRFIENIVAIELFRKKANKEDMNIYYWQDTTGKEVDFVVKEGSHGISLIQVCWNLEKEITKQREVKSLLKAMEKFHLSESFIITENYEAEEKTKDKTIKYIPLWKWLLEA